MTVTLITGASSGTGRSLARRLAAAGDPVAVLARRGELLDSLVKEIEQAGGRGLALRADVTRRNEVWDSVARVEGQLGPVERLVANAGGCLPLAADGFDAAQIEASLNLNVVGVAYCIEAVLPAMLKRRAGHLVTTSSLAAYRGLPTAPAYSAAKAALTSMMESLRVELRPRGVDVTVIGPGFLRVLPKSSKRKKPVSFDVEDVTRQMQRAIDRRLPYYAFPLPMGLAVVMARLLPAKVYDQLLAKFGGAVRL
jgi:short-subunit dehydrogenase